MLHTNIPLFSFSNGAFIMVGVFALVIIGLVVAVMIMMANGNKKKND